MASPPLPPITAVFALSLLAFGATGCVHADRPPPAPPPQVPIAVLRPAWATPSPPFAVDVAPLVRGLSANGGLRPEVTGTDSACVEQPGCLVDAYSSSPFAHVLVVRLAALGDTVLVRATLLDPRRGTEEAGRQQVVQNATLPRVEEALFALGTDLASPFAPPPRPPPSIAKSGWFWAILAGGAAVTGAAIGAAVWASEPRPDGIISPP